MSIVEPDSLNFYRELTKLTPDQHFQIDQVMCCTAAVQSD